MSRGSRRISRRSLRKVARNRPAVHRCRPVPDRRGAWDSSAAWTPVTSRRDSWRPVTNEQAECDPGQAGQGGDFAMAGPGDQGKAEGGDDLGQLRPDQGLLGGRDQVVRSWKRRNTLAPSTAATTCVTLRARRTPQPPHEDEGDPEPHRADQQRQEGPDEEARQVAGRKADRRPVDQRGEEEPDREEGVETAMVASRAPEDGPGRNGRRRGEESKIRPLEDDDDRLVGRRPEHGEGKETPDQSAFDAQLAGRDGTGAGTKGKRGDGGVRGR